MKNAYWTFKREFKSYFDSPVAYVFLMAFLALAGFMTFTVAMFYERRQADLGPFFFWHPWIYLLLVPAATMGLWADERRNGTAELLLTLPVTTLEVLAGKFMAAWAFMGVALALTFPVAATAGWLGSPDWGAVFCAYAGSFLLAGAASAIGLFASSLSRSSTVGFVASLAMVFLLLIIGFTPVVSALASWGVPGAVVDGIASLSLLSHFESMQRGVFDMADVFYYTGAIAFFVSAAKMAVDGRRGATGGAAGLVAIVAVAAALCTISSSIPLRLDLTAERLYTLSDGSRKVLSKLEKEATLKYFVSTDAAEMPMELKTYSQEVRNLLKEYVRASGGKLVLEEYDPTPDSDAEEWAQKYGIEPQTVNPFGSPVYFGVAAVCGDAAEALPALSPRTQATLEYDLTRLVTRAQWPEKPVIGVMTSIPDALGGGMDPMAMMRGAQSRGWVAFAELARDYDVRKVETDADKIDKEIKTLVVFHAKNLSDKTLYAIDQFVLGGGKLIACTDPMSLKELISAPQQMGMPRDEPSTLGKLFDAWGVSFDTSKVTCDLAAATQLNNGRNGVMEEPAFLSLRAAAMDKSDILVSRLTQTTFPFAGDLRFDGKKAPGLKFTPLVSTSADKSSSTGKAGIMMGMGSTKQAQPDGRSRTIVARLEGEFKTAYPKGPDGTNDVSKALAKGRNSVLLFADTDFLADEFCIRTVRTPFGNAMQPMNENIPLFSNAIEQFAGREELIGMRTRGASDRPFEVVDRLEAAAMAKGQQKEAEFQEEVRRTQDRINALRSENSGDRALLTQGQQEEMKKLNKALAAARRDLKNLRKELTGDIVSLGTFLKWLNIALMPLVVALFGIVRWRARS